MSILSESINEASSNEPIYVNMEFDGKNYSCHASDSSSRDPNYSGTESRTPSESLRKALRRVRLVPVRPVLDRIRVFLGRDGWKSPATQKDAIVRWLIHELVDKENSFGEWSTGRHVISVIGLLSAAGYEWTELATIRDSIAHLAAGKPNDNASNAIAAGTPKPCKVSMDMPWVGGDGRVTAHVGYTVRNNDGSGKLRELFANESGQSPGIALGKAAAKAGIDFSSAGQLAATRIGAGHVYLGQATGDDHNITLNLLRFINDEGNPDRVMGALALLATLGLWWPELDVILRSCLHADEVGSSKSFRTFFPKIAARASK